MRHLVYRPSQKRELESIDLEGGSPFEMDKKLKEIIDLKKVSYQDFSRSGPEEASAWLERLIFGSLSDD